jgi:hypothetical protein
MEDAPNPQNKDGIVPVRLQMCYQIEEKTKEEEKDQNQRNFSQHVNRN